MRYLYTLYAVLTFVVFFLLLFPLFLLLGLFKNGRSAIWLVIRAWSYMWFFLLAMPVRRVFLQRPEKGQGYIVVANHSSYLDTALIFRVLPFMVRPLAAQEYAGIPLFGFLYRKMAVLVDRSNERSKALSVRLLHRVLRRECSIFIFPEGGLNETERPLKHFYSGAFRIARETGTPILPLVFPDTVKRWQPGSFWKWKPGICRAVFLPAVMPDEVPGNVEALQTLVFEQMETALIRMRAQ